MTFSCALLYSPPADQRKKVAAAVLAYGKARLADGSSDGEDTGYLAKYLASDIEVGKPFVLNKVNADLLLNALLTEIRQYGREIQVIEKLMEWGDS
jgi:hypothetical protein